METGYRDDNGREESSGRRLVGQRTVENFGIRKALKDATNRMMMMMMMSRKCWCEVHGNGSATFCLAECGISFFEASDAATSDLGLVFD
jgi:hypothetical protein